MRFYIIWALFLPANGGLCAMHPQLKRIAQPDTGQHFLFKRARPIELPLPSIATPVEPLIQEVPVSFECRYFGQKYCESRFENERDEWQHIIQFHGIIAARYDYP